MPVRIVIPVSQGDVALLGPYVDLYRALGGAPRHPVLLLPTRSVASHAHQAAERMKAWSASVEVIEWQDENYNVWPFAGNAMWQHAVEHILIKLRNGDSLPWFYNELDTTPLAEGWADKLEAEYALSGCQCMGTQMPSRVYIGDPKDGKFSSDRWIPGHPVENIPFMPSPAIFPADMRTLTGGMWRSPRQDAWDKFLKFYWNRSLHVSKLIQHRWRTVNYREVEGKIICDDAPENIAQKYEEAGEVSPEAVVLHGCKDGSLARLIRSRCKGLPQPPAPVEPAPQPRQQAAPPPAMASPMGKVGYDTVGWNVVSGMGQGGPQPAAAAPLPPMTNIPPIQFEPDEVAKFAPVQHDPIQIPEATLTPVEVIKPAEPPKADAPPVKRKGGRPPGRPKKAQKEPALTE